MRRLLLAVAALLITASTFAQTISPDYQDGKIWFRIKSDYRTNHNLTEDPYKLPISTIPFLDKIGESHQFTNMSHQLYAAKTSVELQCVYLLEFSDFG